MPAKMKRLTQSARAGLTFPVARVRRLLKQKLGKRMRVRQGAATYLAAVMEYLTAEVLEISGNVTRQMSQRRLNARHMLLACRMDEEINKFLSHVIIPAGGVVPSIHAALLPKGQRPQPSNQDLVLPVTFSKAATHKAKAKPKAAPKANAAAKTARVATKGHRGGGARNAGITTLNERSLLSGHRLCVLSGDIVNVTADAIVVPSSANRSLGGQIGGRLSIVGGAAFHANVNKLKGNIPITQAQICDGVNIGADKVILCNGPGWGNNAADSVPQLAATVVNCLKLAEKHKLASICFPSIGSGVGGFPKQTAAQTILKTLSDYFKKNTQSSVSHVFFVLYDQESIAVYLGELQRLVE